MNLEIIKTNDNSDTILNRDFNEIFHSTNGALSESLHVFIKSGLEFISQNKKELTIFEVGFGTGLNAILTYNFAKENNLFIKYYSIEFYPLEENIWKKLNYTDFCDKDIFYNLHEANWEQKCLLSDNFELYKINKDLLSFDTDKKFDLVYFDAFSPEKQPELWTKDIFDKIYSFMNNNSVLVTYCAKGQVRRDMQEVGFIVEKLKGPLGKREILRASKK